MESTERGNVVWAVFFLVLTLLLSKLRGMMGTMSSDKSMFTNIAATAQ